MLKTLALKPGDLNQLCTGCVTDNNGGRVARTIIVSALILLGFGNWDWKKYFSNKKEISQQK